MVLNDYEDLLLWAAVGHQIIPEGLQSIKRFSIFLSPCCYFATDNVVDVADRKAVYFHAALPGILEELDSVRGEYQVKIEWAIL